MLNIDKITSDNELIFKLKGSLDRSTFRKFESTIISTISPSIKQKNMSIILDCSQLNYLGVSGIKSLLKIRKLMKMANRSLVFKKMNCDTQKVLAEACLDSGFVFENKGVN